MTCCRHHGNWKVTESTSFRLVTQTPAARLEDRVAAEEGQPSGQLGQLSKMTAQATFLLEGLHRPSPVEQSEQASSGSRETGKPVADHSQVSENGPRSRGTWCQSSSYLKLSLWDTRMDWCLMLLLLSATSCTRVT